ncbi:hypothetical protein ACFZDI_06195 [Streptomyces sp. NPDC007907]|uniref:hypothetical protein n=1 Tax=Streptomyces sp. NPDC007907 TaxID=3364789 RepID=UPI0036E486F4
MILAETPEQAALWDHCLTRPTCRATDAQGANLNLPCDTAARLTAEYRQARRST